MTENKKEKISDLLYTIGQESENAYSHMIFLCTLLDVPYPPKQMEKANQQPTNAGN